MKEQVTETKTVSKDVFTAAVDNWTNVVGTSGTTFYDNVALARTFDIPMQDMQGMVNESINNGAVTVNAYVGAVKYVGSDEKEHFEQHLYFVGVDRSGNEIWEVNGQSAIYDFVSPCPPVCGS